MDQFYVKRANLEDFNAMFAMKSDPEDIRWSGFAVPPDPVRYQDWYIANIYNPRRIMFLGFSDHEASAYAHFSRDTDADPFDISYGVSPKFRGKGLGSLILVESVREAKALGLSTPRYQTWVAMGNVGSERAAAKADFYCSDHIKDQEFLYPEKRIDKMRLWIKR